MKSHIQKPLSLRMQLTLMTALLSAVSCLLLSAYISTTAILSMDKIENSVIAVLPMEAFEASEDTDESPSQTGALNSSAAFDHEEFTRPGIYLDVESDLSEEIHDTRAEFWKKSLLATLLIVMANSVLVYFIVGFALKPLAAFTKRVEEISDKNIEDIVEVPHPSKELLRLTDVFNAMMKRLGRAFTQQRQFASRAAHELRTPLAVMQTKLDVYQKQDIHSGMEYEELIDMCGTQTARLSHVVNLLLEMTQLQSASRTDRISLSALIEEVLCDLLSVADQKNITLIQNEGDALITGNDTLVYRAVYNLTENAIKYNRDGGSVNLSVADDADHATIRITDTGAGISEEDRDKIFEPFYRAQKRLTSQRDVNLRADLQLSPESLDSQSNINRSPSESVVADGAGLGLSLVKEIATEHGGDVYVEDSSDAGTCIVLTLRK